MASSQYTGDIQSRHRATLLYASLAARAIVALLAYISSFLPLFDTSPTSVLPGDTSRLTGALLRWDSFHFGAIAIDGYTHEHQWAFLPGLPLTMRYGGILLSLLGLTSNGWPAILNAGAIGAAVCGILSTQTLYELSLYHLGKPDVAFLAALLSLLPGSPAALLFAPYTEPYFALFTYQGMLQCTRGRYFCSALFFALSTAFRSNGLMNAGFLLWDLAAQDMILHRKMPRVSKISQAFILTLLVFTPFLAHQYTAYRVFCGGDQLVHSDAPWCLDTLPFIYGYVQGKYWDNGFLRYWTVAQAPNIGLALPILTTIISFCVNHLRSGVLVQALNLRRPLTEGETPPRSPFLRASLTPHAIHAVIFSMVLLFVSNTQIALRAASAMPTTYWAGAWLLLEKPRAGRAWVRWSMIWGVLSVVMWTAFLPPA
ncbi:glycosyltransferase family 76 protein [Peniophora sp. CONT]|nr:glycosyltransferase family 76 protein [Peniophora sp. CONT]